MFLRGLIGIEVPHEELPRCKKNKTANRKQFFAPSVSLSDLSTLQSASDSNNEF